VSNTHPHTHAVVCCSVRSTHSMKLLQCVTHSQHTVQCEALTPLYIYIFIHIYLQCEALTPSYIYMYICIYIYIYIYPQCEALTPSYIHIFIYIYLQCEALTLSYIYIYLYIHICSVKHSHLLHHRAMQ